MRVSSARRRALASGSKGASVAAVNLAASMRGPTRVGKRSKTPVLMFNKNAANSLDQNQCEHPKDRYTPGRPLRGRWRARLLVRCRLFAAPPLLCVIAGKLAGVSAQSPGTIGSPMILAGHRCRIRPHRDRPPGQHDLVCRTGSARSAGLALPRLMSFNARQQFLFQPSPALAEPLNLHFETMEELHDLEVLVTKRVEA